MLRYRIQTKLAMMLGIVMLVFAGGMIVLFHWENAKVQSILDGRVEEKRTLVVDLTNLLGEKLKTFAYDYSFWDDMVSFINRPDSLWAQENIDIGLETYNSTVAWVYDTQSKLVYSTSDSQYSALLNDATLDTVIIGAFSRDWFSHFFYHGPQGVLEIFTAPVQPSADNERKAPPAGFLIVGRILNIQYVERIGDMTHITAAIMPANSMISPPRTGTITFYQPLPGVDGETVAFLYCHGYDSLYAMYDWASRIGIILFILLCCTIFSLLFISMFVWINKPLRKISSALERGDVQMVTQLAETRSEFGQIARLIKDFFKQKMELEIQIEAQNRAQQALSQSESRYRLIAEQTGQVVYDWDVESGKISWAGAIETITGFSHDEFKKINVKDWEQMIHPQDRSKAMADLDMAFKAGSKYIVEYRLQRRDGSYIFIEDNGIFIKNDRNGSIQMLGTMRDITEHKQAEEEQRSLQDKLEKSQRMESLAILAGGVAHDLNNMLGPVVGYSELLLMNMPPDSKDAGKVRRIMKSAQDAADVIQDLLTLARRGRYEMKSLNINQVVFSFFESTGFNRLKERYGNVELKTSLAESLSPIKGSRQHLEKVLMNLATNACEAMPAGGILTIETEEKYMEALLGGSGNIDKGQYILLRVKDSGHGVDKSDLHRIFEPYFSKKHLGHSGSGLGLSVVYGVVKDHGGYYDIISEPQKGTEFILYFSACDIPIEKTVKNDRTLPGGTESILIIDDSPEQREMAFDLISSLGYRVNKAVNGHEAIRYLQTNQADLLILDMIMEPDFDGLATYCEVIKIRSNQKALIVSGFSATENVQELHRLGVGTYIKKPYTLETIARAIRTELDIDNESKLGTSKIYID